MKNRLTYIYILVDPISNECRYVGKSVNPKYRLRKHIAVARNPKTHVECWIKSLRNKDKKPEMIIIDEVIDWIYWEKFYISYFKFIGCDLTNLCDGGIGSTNYKMPQERKDKLSKIFKGRKPWNTGKKYSKEHKKILSEAQSKRHGKLTIEDVYYIRNSNKSRKELAKEFNVHHTTISKIVLRVNYKHLK